jgi:ubiquinone biosynthesis protein COQ4
MNDVHILARTNWRKTMQVLNRDAFQNAVTNKEMQTLITTQYMESIEAFLGFMVADVEDDEPIDRLMSSLLPSRAYQLAIEEMKADPTVADIIKERYIAPPHNLDALLQCPPDSLGYIYAATLKQKGFELIDTSQIPMDSEANYIESRWQQTHDIWHIVTGFEVSEIDEIALQAFYLAQFRLPLASMAIASSLISSTLLTPEDLPQLLQGIQKGWQMGIHAKPFIAQKWEEAWEKPLSQWRTQLNVSAGSLN